MNSELPEGITEHPCNRDEARRERIAYHVLERWSHRTAPIFYDSQVPAHDIVRLDHWVATGCLLTIDLWTDL